jgi:hypothetical protein
MKALEEASGPLIFCQWVEIRKIVLQFIKKQMSFLGANAKGLFSRD